MCVFFRVAETDKEMEDSVLDEIIRRLLDAKNGRTPKQVHLTEVEIRQLCVTSREIFISQPNLLELEAPIKICGNSYFFPKFCKLVYPSVISA